jgi:crossover junction endodeoxyribonuclease RuvC
MSKSGPTHILGCDPGLQGAFCFYEISTKFIHIFDMPLSDGRVDPTKLAGIINTAKSITSAQVHAAVENVNSLPRQAGAFNFGRSVGVVHGVLGALGIPYTLVSPNEWKGACGLRRGVNESQDQVKTRARELATKLWPEMAAEFKRVRDDGRAEACLIARHYANRLDK